MERVRNVVALAHSYWASIVKKGDYVLANINIILPLTNKKILAISNEIINKIFAAFNNDDNRTKFEYLDATCGRGKDTLFLARQALTPESGRVVSMDIQQVALDSAKDLLNKEIADPNINKRIELIKMSHENIVSYITPSLKLITYNLGYLPGGDKEIVTQATSTMKSLHSATQALPYGSWISITCYPGHSEGSKEEKEILEWIKTLPPDHWTVFLNSWPNNMKNGPSLILLEKLVPHSMRKSH